MSGADKRWSGDVDPLGIERPSPLRISGAADAVRGASESKRLAASFGAEQFKYIDARHRLYWYQDGSIPTLPALATLCGADNLVQADTPVVQFCPDGSNTKTGLESCKADEADVPQWWPSLPSALICGLDGFAPERQLGTHSAGKIERYAAALSAPRTVVPTGWPMDVKSSSKGANIWFPFDVPPGSLVTQIDMAFRIRPAAPSIYLDLLHAAWPPEANLGLVKLLDHPIVWSSLQTPPKWEGESQETLAASVMISLPMNKILPPQGSVFLVIFVDKIQLDGTTRFGVMGGKVAFRAPTL